MSLDFGAIAGLVTINAQLSHLETHTQKQVRKWQYRLACMMTASTLSSYSRRRDEGSLLPVVVVVVVVAASVLVLSIAFEPSPQVVRLDYERLKSNSLVINFQGREDDSRRGWS